jgi:hypothetical protein
MIAHSLLPLLFLENLLLLSLFLLLRSSPELSALEPNPEKILAQPCFSLLSPRPLLLLDPVDPDGGPISYPLRSLSSLLAAAAAALALAEDVTLSPRILRPVRMVPLVPGLLLLVPGLPPEPVLVPGLAGLPLVPGRRPVSRHRSPRPRGSLAVVE